MKVLGIAASPRKNGNSEVLLDKALEGASSKGAKVEKIAISELKIKPCRGDTSCIKNSVCFIKDDMRFLYKKLGRADALIIASPIYFGSIPAQLKAVIDRCQSVWAKGFIRENKKKRRKKRAIFICVSGHKRRRFFENSKEIIKIFFAVLGFKLFKELYVPNLENSGEIFKKKPILNKAFHYGAGILG